MLDNHVNTANSIVRVLRRVPKDARVPLAESISDKLYDILYKVEKILIVVFLTSLLFFIE